MKLPAQPSVPSIHDTHCDGPGLEHSTIPWPRYRSFYYRWLAEDGTKDVPLPPRVDLRGKTVLISGANSGIGKEAAYICALWGAHVIIACRDPPPHEDHPEQVIDEFVARSHGIITNQLVEWWKVDFADLASVKALGDRFISSGRTLDLLFNNAGLNMKKFVQTMDGFELVNQVNYLAHVLLTYTLLPAMKNAKAPRIINTSSSFHYGGTLDFANFNAEKEVKLKKGDEQAVVAEMGEWYCDSKLKLAMWNKELQSRMSRSAEYRHVITHAIHPGYVASNVWRSGWLKQVPGPIQFLLNIGLKYLAIDSKQGSLAMLYAALLPERGIESLTAPAAAPPKEDVPERFTEQVGGRFYLRTQEHPTRPEIEDRTARARLWNRTNEDIKAAKYGLDFILPGPLPGLK
ncbi:NAD(P)-binding protein [Tilletiaria anomala UBC 951]|uniref:NAD(P)-binding protein n=1 Tax=Tilletiaria anomala (strain ATCC 24038 / CBS 436.72 / UBC 951) TaxID=1037660 RepID=A0A066V9J0_TILAU|nr:NAD(P)-binding protein [Tilletiaria anomala UBC 951]KDN35409.1 NAD(P)-binding protein [Tilletiaria anomala UBC 951]